MPELLAVGIKVNVAVVPDPPKLADMVTVVPEMELTVVPAGKVTPPSVIIAVIPGRIAFIEPVITTVAAPTVIVVPVTPMAAPNVKVAVAPEPPKTFDIVTVVPAIAVTTVPAAKVHVPAVIATGIPTVMPVIDPVITAVEAPIVIVVAVIPINGGMSQLLVTSWSWVMSCTPRATPES